tara:strand:+ start:3231 stop:3482 length:252 start_codon:yes stop_codon:yes gene_type:complete
MPQGMGTYGSKKGRPPGKKKRAAGKKKKATALKLIAGSKKSAAQLRKMKMPKTPKKPAMKPGVVKKTARKIGLSKVKPKRKMY